MKLEMKYTCCNESYKYFYLMYDKHLCQILELKIHNAP